MSEKRWVLLIASEVGRTDSVSDRAMERLVDAIGDEGYEVVRTTSPEDGLSLVTSDPILLGHPARLGPRGQLAVRRARRARHHPRRSPSQQESPDLPHRRPHAGLRAAAGSGQAGARVHPPLRRHAGLHRLAPRHRHRALSRAAAAALLPRAAEVQRPVRLLLGRARTHGRRRLPEASRRAGVPPLLRRKPAALRPRHLVRAAGLVARPHRASGRLRAQRRAHLRRRLDLLRARRLQHLEPDRRPRRHRAGRHRARRRELPQIHLPLADRHRRAARLLQADAQRLRHDRPGAAEALLARNRAGADRAQPVRRRRALAAAHLRRRHQLHLRRPLLQRRPGRRAARASPSPACTSTRPGTPTPSSTPSTADATRWACPTIWRTARHLLRAVHAQDAGGVLHGLDDPRQAEPTARRWTSTSSTKPS